MKGPSRLDITAACARARREGVPATIGEGYAVRVDKLQPVNPAARTSRREWFWLYTLVSPAGEAFGGMTTIGTFVPFVQRYLQQQRKRQAKAAVR